MIVRGVDVSRHQPPERCDWTRAHEAGVRFCYVKGSEGAGGVGAYVDPAAPEHFSRIRRSRVVPGMYHFARPDNRFRANPNDPIANGHAEADHAIATAIDLGVAWSGLPVAIDHEKATPRELGITHAQRDAFLLAMIDRVTEALGRVPVLYTGANFVSQQHSPEIGARLRERGVTLWLVNYTEAADPERMIPGLPWSIWQHSGGGSFAYAPPIPGLPSPIDQNIYRGGPAEFAALCR